MDKTTKEGASSIKSAKWYLEQMGMLNTTSDYRDLVGKAALRLLETHLKENHSGGSWWSSFHWFRRILLALEVIEEMDSIESVNEKIDKQLN